MTSDSARSVSLASLRRRLLVGGLVGVCALTPAVTAAAPSFASGSRASVARVGAVSAASAVTGLHGASVGARYDVALSFAGRPTSFWVKEYADTVQEPQSPSVLGLAPAPTLPPGLALDGSTGHVVGTPTEAGTFRFTIYADVARRSVARAFTITVTGAPVAASTVLAPATAGSAYRTTVLAIGAGPIRYEIASGSLPDGLALDGATGVVSGTPTASGTTTLSIRATNASGSTVLPLTLDVAPASATPAPALTMPTVAPPVVAFGHRIAISVAANSTLPVTYSITDGRLPRGVHLDPATGVLSGFPTDLAGGASGFDGKPLSSFGGRITATSSAGTAISLLDFSVRPATKLLTRVHVPATFVGPGRVPIVFTGLLKGERWQLREDGAVVGSGRAAHAGTLSTSVTMGRISRDRVHTFVLSASRRIGDPATRAATSFAITSITIAKRLTYTVKSTEAAGNAVTIKGLAPGEPVQIIRGHHVASRSHAFADGSWGANVTEGPTDGLIVRGATSKRTVTIHVKE